MEHEINDDENKILDELVSNLGLKSRALNALDKVGVYKLSQLVRLTEKQVLSIDNIGKSGLNDIKTKLSGKGLSLSVPVMPPDPDTPIWFIWKKPVIGWGHSILIKLMNCGVRITSDVLRLSRDDLAGLGFDCKEINEIESTLERIGLKS